MSSQTCTLYTLMVFAMFVTGIRPKGPQKSQSSYKHDKSVNYDVTTSVNLTQIVAMTSQDPGTHSWRPIDLFALVWHQKHCRWRHESVPYAGITPCKWKCSFALELLCWPVARCPGRCPTPWQLTNCSNLDDEPHIIVPFNTQLFFIVNEKVFSSHVFLSLQHNYLRIPSQFWLKSIIVENENSSIFFMNGPSHMEGGQVNYGELDLWSVLLCSFSLWRRPQISFWMVLSNKGGHLLHY